MIHDPIERAIAAPPAAPHPMMRPAPDGWLHSMVLYFREPGVRVRLEVAILTIAALLVLLIASGFVRAALAGRL